jgi:hypothetical protein
MYILVKTYSCLGIYKAGLPRSGLSRVFRMGNSRDVRNLNYRLERELRNDDFVNTRNYAFAPRSFFNTRKADSAFLW